MDYFAMDIGQLHTQWHICKADNAERAATFEWELGNFFPKYSRNWYLALMLRAHESGWAE